jgi:hypothetical protein
MSNPAPAGDAATLMALSKALHERAVDLEYVGRHLASKASSATWRCAKGDRYRAALQGRRLETDRLAQNLNEIAHTIRAQALAAEAAAAPPAP